MPKQTDFKQSFKMFLFYFTLFSTVLSAQKSSFNNKEIIDLVNSTEEKHLDGNTKEVFLDSKKLISISEKINDEMGLSCGYYYLGYCLYNVGKYKESIEYLKKAQQYEVYLKEDILHQSRIYGLLADNYLSLELYSLATTHYHKSLQLHQSVKNKNTLYYLSESTSYSYLAILYNHMNIQDSMYYYLKKEKSSLNSISEKKEFPEKGCAYNDFGHYHLKTNKIDSAQYYFKQTINFFKDEANACKYDAMVGLADLEIKNNNYEKAYDYYNQALEGFKSTENSLLVSNLYQKMANAYIAEGNVLEGKKYQDLYLKTSHEIEEGKKKERDFVINEMMKDESSQQQNEVRENRMTIFVIIGLLILVTLIIIIVLRKNKSKNQENQEITDRLLSEKAIDEREKSILKLQLNESYDEVMILAKENNPQFFVRFQEIYPHFTPKMLKINPNFKVTELTFASYIYLGFNTKEIADYTYKAVKTVENNRYNFRKKLELSPEQDLQEWLRNYIDRQ